MDTLNTAELDARLAKANLHPTQEQLKTWVEHGLLLPPARRGLGQNRGTTRSWATDTPERVAIIMGTVKTKHANRDRAALQLLKAGFELRPVALRRMLAGIVERMESADASTIPEALRPFVSGDELKRVFESLLDDALQQCHRAALPNKGPMVCLDERPKLIQAAAASQFLGQCRIEGLNLVVSHEYSPLIHLLWVILFHIHGNELADAVQATIRERMATLFQGYEI